ncbi:hypothetical protein GIB67_020213 [Kingdonia uniflora]|uniref:Protein kinase domain-containing protein n=1 Tax=Kingdonia uniflora TaxID=39325 RepID=A0A7J7P1C5_9MAGN|nr:hypothetical protein GIB67_020213 [Kingdonia uniflora]
MDRKAWKIITLVVLIANIQLIIFAISNGLSISFFFIHAADILGILSIITLVFLHFLGDDLGPIEQQFIPEIRKQLVDRFPTGFLYEDLIAATNNFRYKLGSGESSSVFKGKLNDGTSVAVKRVEPSEYGEWEFQRDISTVAMVKHDHLVHLRGYCSHMTETGKNIFLIVYDFYPFGSLDSWIIPKIQGGRYLDWKKRYTVALDVAKALVYLHHDCRPRILHLKIKLKNILIDDNFRAVLSDFGFPKLMGKDEYTPPESGLGHEISETCDIHSFGKVLLDLFFGGRDDFYTKYDFSQQQIFHAFMQKSLKGKKLRDLIDKRLIEDKEAINEKEASTLVHVVLCCLDEDPNKRPGDMQKVVGMLEARKLSGNSQAVFDIAKSAAVLVYRHISYRFCYKKYVNDLQSKVKDNLLRLENDVKGKVDLARDAGDVIHKVVEHWLEKVDEVRDEVGELHCQAGEIKSCFKGWLSARYRLGKDSKKKIVIVDELLTEGRSFSSVSNPAPVPPQLVEHFDAFASREPTKKEVIQALMDRNTHLIGVYGMGGVGKTTMMKEIYREVEAKLFHKVVLLTVSQNPDLRGIQTQIAKSMGLTIEEDAMKIRAQRLSKRLKQEKSILLILDDVQTTLELAEVGIIPCRDGQNTCKVLITSRNLDVCRSMKTTKNIEVQRLSERDSLELFLRNVGGVDCKALRKISADIASECEGLPFAILAFARALQHSDEAVWPDIIKQIRKSLFEGMSLFDDLQRKVQNDLVRLETDLKAKVDLARKNGDVIHKVVEQWLDNVAKVRNEMNELHHEAEKINSCFKGRHSACHRLCEESEKKVVVVDELLVEGRSFSIVSNPAPAF